MKRTPLRRRSKSPLKKLKDALWEECKRIVRARDGNTCYTCGAKGLEGGNWHTGHFIPDSTSSVELRYDLKNLRSQCRFCNFWKSGDWVTFEQNLIRDHGAEYVAELKRRNQATKGRMYREEWYIEKINEYKKL